MLEMELLATLFQDYITTNEFALSIFYYISTKRPKQFICPFNNYKL